MGAVFSFPVFANSVAMDFASIFVGACAAIVVTGPLWVKTNRIWTASSEFGTYCDGSGEPAHPRSLTRTSAARLYKQ